MYEYLEYILWGVLVGAPFAAMGIRTTYRRPPQKVTSFKTRYSPTIWSKRQMNTALLSFENAWLKVYPSDKRRLHKVLNSLNIAWVSNRWSRDDQIAAAETLSSTDLKLWEGPRLPSGEYKMNYTALPEGLVQIVIYNMDKEVVTSKGVSQDYKDIIKQVKLDLQKETSHGKTDS